jgi:FkbH-like protein
MVLREDSFSAVRINWRPKTENIASIAEELNIGLDSMVFLDDNPNERELMRQVFPEVLTPDLPKDPSLYRSTIERLPQFQSLVVTEEDQIRVQQYRTKRQREEVRAKTQSLDEYLQALEISLQLSRANDGTLPRLHQLFERTNQFNLTTRRYTLSQMTAFVHDGGCRLYALKAQDRFGDHGLVAAALVHMDPSCWTLDSFVMSCRVIGYGVETALLAVVTEGARDAGCTTVIGEYVPTAKNAPARDFYSRNGFKEEGAKDGVTRWTMCLNESRIARPGWIKMEITDAT